MKDRKLKTGLTCIIIISTFVTMFMWLAAIIGESGKDLMFFYKATVNDGGVVLKLNWSYVGAYIGLLIIAFTSWLTKLIRFTIPAVKDKEDYAAIQHPLEILIGLGLIFTTVSLFLPLGAYATVVEPSIEAFAEPTKIVCSRIFALIGLPLSFISAFATAGLSMKSK